MHEKIKHIIPEWPVTLQNVDIVRARFVLDFLSPCTLQPADFLGLGRILKISGRQSINLADTTLTDQWASLFQPPLSKDPVSQRAHQKPAPAFVILMPITQKMSFDIGDQLDLEVLFIGTGIPLIHVFMRSLGHLGRLGLVAGEGQFELTEAFATETVGKQTAVWRQGESLAAIPWPVLPLDWVIKDHQIGNRLAIKFVTPARLMVDGKPLKKPRFGQIFPFMLRRVTSMLHAHCGIEASVETSMLVDLGRQLETYRSDFTWRDWRSVGQRKLSIGGFVGEIEVGGAGLEEIYWVLSVASLFGVGKGATYGSGQFLFVP